MRTGGRPVLPLNDAVVLPICKPQQFSDDECKKIIALAKPETATVALTGTGYGEGSVDGRISLVNTLYPSGETGWIFDRIESTVASCMRHFRFNVTGFFEGGQLYRYADGGYLDEHMDIGRGHMSTRKLGVTVQLSPPGSYEGGELVFADARQSAPREFGSVVVFPTYMRHRVTRVTRGTRISFVTWIHGPPFQ
jgi:PKHD-type hydroxylase